jgi:hypothetical protein
MLCANEAFPYPHAGASLSSVDKIATAGNWMGRMVNWEWLWPRGRCDPFLVEPICHSPLKRGGGDQQRVIVAKRGGVIHSWKRTFATALAPGGVDGQL